MNTYSHTNAMILSLNNLIDKATSIRGKLESGLTLDEDEQDYILDRIESAKEELYDVAYSYFDEADLDALKKKQARPGSPA